MSNQLPDLVVPEISDLSPEIAALAARYRRANGPVIGIMNRLGGSLEAQLGVVPQALREQIDRAAAAALEKAHDLAAQGRRAPSLGRQGPLAAAVLSGIAGGAGGIASALAELPVTVTVMLHAIRREAQAAGYDPDDPAIRAECLAVFGAGSPLAADDGVNTAFLSARLTLTGPAIQRVIAVVAPRLGIAMGQKLAAQSVPVIGAVTGAAMNAAFLHYYREVAAIRFALLRLAEVHGPAQVSAAFASAAEPAPVKTAARG
ncbi:MAG: EcsC family protein [Paracoccaceae bacterium]